MEKTKILTIFLIPITIFTLYKIFIVANLILSLGMTFAFIPMVELFMFILAIISILYAISVLNKEDSEIKYPEKDLDFNPE